MLAIDLLLQTLVVLALTNGGTGKGLLFAIGFVGLLHAIGIRIFLGLAAKILRDQEKAKAVKAARKAS